MISEIHNCNPFTSYNFIVCMRYYVLLGYVISNCKGAYKLYPLKIHTNIHVTVVPQTVAKIAIGDYPMASGDWL